jgi:hypothetical protein
MGNEPGGVLEVIVSQTRRYCQRIFNQPRHQAWLALNLFLNTLFSQVMILSLVWFHARLTSIPSWAKSRRASSVLKVLTGKPVNRLTSHLGATRWPSTGIYHL